MLISFGFLVFTLTSAMWETHTLFEHVYARERAQIVADNAAMVLGQNDRKLFQWLETMNGRFQALEPLHHAKHACAQVPVTQAACEPVDKALELQMAELRRAIELRISTDWLEALAAAQKEFVRLNVPPGEVRRPLIPPVKRFVCALCGGVTRWSPQAFSYAVHVQSERAEATLEKRDRWNYRLKDHEA